MIKYNLALQYFFVITIMASVDAKDLAKGVEKVNITESKEEKKEETKQLPKYLIRPTAILRMFHEAARIGFEDLLKCVGNCQSNNSLENAQKLLDTFIELERCVSIHKTHEDNVLYPTLLKSINNRLDNKNYTPSKEKLEQGLRQVPKFTDEHKQDHQILHQLEDQLKLFVETLKKNTDKNDEQAVNALENLESVSSAVKEWTIFHEAHLRREEGIMAPLMKGVGNRDVKIQMAKDILGQNKDLVLKYQFEYVLKQLLSVKEWYCPMTKHTYKNENDAEMLIAYLHCFRMIVNDQNEYQLFVNKAVNIVDEARWKKVLVYGLDKK
eukprot:238978_1